MCKTNNSNNLVGNILKVVGVAVVGVAVYELYKYLNNSSSSSSFKTDGKSDKTDGLFSSGLNDEICDAWYGNSGDDEDGLFSSGTECSFDRNTCPSCGGFTCFPPNHSIFGENAKTNPFVKGFNKKRYFKLK